MKIAKIDRKKKETRFFFDLMDTRFTAASQIFNFHEIIAFYLYFCYSKNNNMQKKFNITGLCFADEHYMADISEKLAQTQKMVEEGDYFVINRPRQYGKTTLLYAITEKLEQTGRYLVFNISFEGIGDLVFTDEIKFSTVFGKLLAKKIKKNNPDAAALHAILQTKLESLDELSDVITEIAEATHKKIVLLIDEVDKSSNNQLFISFLAMLRHKYLDRRDIKTFHAVILAGVHDVKSLKSKIRPDEEQKYNSPWNIASEFKVDMNLLPAEIKPMLDDYAAEKNVLLNTQYFAERLFYYTSGYPFLVSKLCKIMDEEILPKKSTQEWTNDDLEKAVRVVVKNDNVNFDTLIKNLENNENLYQLVHNVAINGENIAFNHHEPGNNWGMLYGVFADKNRLIIHNRIYNEVIVNYMTAKMNRISVVSNADFGSGYRNADKTSLNMELVLLKFQAFMREQYDKKDRDFLERNGRLVFLAFMKPILNGHGYDFKEAQISEERRLDVTITFYQHKYVAELKIWRGAAAHEEGLEQLSEYLAPLRLNEGYLIIFDHSQIKSWKAEWITYQEKRIFTVWV
jgi:AAA-like domain